MLFLISSVFTKYQNKKHFNFVRNKILYYYLFLFSLYFCPPLSLKMGNIYSGLYFYSSIRPPVRLSLIQPVFDTIDIFKDLRVSALNSYTLTLIDPKKTPIFFRSKVKVINSYFCLIY